MKANKAISYQTMFNDKSKHFIISFFLFVIIYWFWKNAVGTVAVVLGLGILKEIFDGLRKKNTLMENLLDFSADFLGVGLAVILLVLLYF